MNTDNYIMHAHITTDIMAINVRNSEIKNV